MRKSSSASSIISEKTIASDTTSDLKSNLSVDSNNENANSSSTISIYDLILYVVTLLVLCTGEFDIEINHIRILYS